MKYLILFLFIYNVHAGQLPPDWVSPTNLNWNLKWNFSQAVLNKTASKLEDILNAQGEALDSFSSQQSFKKKLELTRYDGTFSVTKNGILGFSSVSSTSAVEFRWTPKTQNSAIETVNFVVYATTDQEALNKKVDELTEKIFSTGKIKNRKLLQKNIKNYFYKTNSTFSNISVFHSRYWMLEGLAADLSVGADGTLGGTIGVKGSLRLRLEWKYNPVLNADDVSLAVPSANDQPDQFVASVLTELDRVSVENTVNDSDGYALEEIRVSVGMSYESGIIGIAGGGVSHVGRLDFRRKKTLMYPTPIEDLQTPIAFFDNRTDAYEQDSRLRFMARRSWRKGLKKILNISDFFIKRVPKKTRSWEVSSINTSFAVSKSGFFGLIGPKSQAQIELRFLKKSNIAEYQMINPVDEMLTLDQLRFRMRLGAFLQVPLVLEFSSFSEVEFYWAPK